MNKIGIVPNFDKDVGFKFTKKVLNWLIERGCTPMVPMEVSTKIAMPEYGKVEEHFYKEADFLLALGGDGTILRIAKNSAIHGTPILGVNLGTLGYLTDIEKKEAFTALEKTISGDYILEKRIMLEAHLSTSTGEEQPLLALNEVCIEKGNLSSMISLSISVNNDYLDEFRADGIIVSTPTGSTAYNLSAGGPILKPDIEAIAITPICPHKLYTRPSVISANDVVKITITGSTSTSPILLLDGQDHIPLEKGSSVIISRAKCFTNIIKTNNKSFYDILKHKIK